MTDEQRADSYAHKDAMRVEVLDTTHSVHALLIAFVNSTNAMLAEIRRDLKDLQAHNKTQDTSIHAALHPEQKTAVRWHATVWGTVGAVLVSLMQYVIGPAVAMWLK
jgi:hypothetical protein